MTHTARCTATALAFLLVAVAFAWPLPVRLRTHLPTPADGDTAVYVWNAWAFHHELAAHGRSPLSTTHVLAAAAPTSLVLHNYTIFADLLAFPLVGRLGVVGAFNAVSLLLPAVAAFTMFLLAFRLTRRYAAGWLAGLAFGFSPFVMARGLGHFSLAGVAPLPLFALCATIALETRRRRYAVGAGAAMAWATLMDPYYGIYCAMIAAALLAFRFLEVSRAPESRLRAALARTASVLGLMAVLLIVAILATGGWSGEITGVRVRVRGLYTPVLIATVSAAIWAAARTRIGPRPAAGPCIRQAGTLVLIGVLTCGFLLAPIVPELMRVLAGGTGLAPPLFWRSGPPGMDLLAFLVPNPVSPLFGAPSYQWVSTLPHGPVENVASVPLVVVAVVAAALIRGVRLPRVWCWLAFSFVLLALGPFVHVAGINTYVPGPWILARYIPVIGAARMPGRLAIVVMLAAAVLFAVAVAHLLASTRRPLLTSSVLTALLLLELSPLPRHLHATSIPEVYAAIPQHGGAHGAVLELPLGLMDGVMSAGAFSPASMFYQTAHGRPIFGGYLSRIPPEVQALYRRDPLLSTLLALSEGREPPPGTEREARAGAPAAVERLRIAFVVIDATRTSARLRGFATDALRLERLAAHEGRELYRPGVRLSWQR